MNYSIFIIAFFLSLIGTWIIKIICTNLGFLERPKKDRWNGRYVAKFGGLAMFLAFIVSVSFIWQPGSLIYFIVIGSGLIFISGLIDDVKPVNPILKLLAQITLAIASYYFGLQFFPVAPVYISLPLTILWFVGIINAINLLDNMDGLAAGISGIISFMIAMGSLFSGNLIIAQLCFVITAVCFGFLVFNFHPAKIFMGDAGSMFLGFLLAALSLYAVDYRSTNIAVSLFLPVILMAIPIFDTSLVTISRLFNRRKISIGGKDHTSHRLVQLGLSERKTVVLLYTICFGIGLCSFFLQGVDLQFWLSIVVLLGISMFFLGAFLVTLKVYDDSANDSKLKKLTESNNVIWSINGNAFPRYYKLTFEFIADVLLVITAYSLSYFLRYEGNMLSDTWIVFSSTIPLVLFIKITVLSISKVYGSVWRFVGVPDLLNILKAVTISSIIVFIFFALKYPFDSFSKSLLIIDFILFCLLLSASRLFYRLLSEFFISQSSKIGKKNVIIIGAGISGNEVLRFINNNNYNYNVIGFIDDDETKKRLSILGKPILGGQEKLSNIVEKYSVDEIIISIQNASEEEMDIINANCISTNIPFKKAAWHLKRKFDIH